MDDGHGLAKGSAPAEELQNQYDRMMDYFGELGFDDSQAKREGPRKVKSYMGVEIHSDKQICRIEEGKSKKYATSWQTLKEEGKRTGGLVKRLELASVIGKFQHTAKLVRGGQQLLCEAYKARDNISAGEGTPWGEDCWVLLHEHAIRDLDRFAGLMPQAWRKYYLDGDVRAENGFFEGYTARSHESMDVTSEAHAGIPVYTTDASGFAGGGFCGEKKFYHEYGADERAPARSSNFRELDTGARALATFAESEEWRDTRVLWRTDNAVSKAIVNNQGTMADSLRPVSSKIQDLCRERGLDLGVCHIRGEENGLADRISRYVWSVDDSDWMMAEEIFLLAQWLTGQDFTLDGGADPVGSNSYLQRFCSKVDSYFDRNLTGENLIANPDYKLIEQYLQHFLRYWMKSSSNTSAVFMLPIWESQPWWRLLRGSILLFWIRQGSRVFTSPEWFAQTPEKLRPANRVDRGRTNWDVMLVWFPCTLLSRGGSAGANPPKSEERTEGRGPAASMLRLSGCVTRDLPRLYAVPPRQMSTV
jgi:hypothetical protein